MTAGDVQIRLLAARKFLEAAEMFLGDVEPSSWQVSGANAVSAGIAASDVICGHVLGYCAKGDGHGEALAVLAEATSPDNEPRKHLAALLNHKPSYQYGTTAIREAQTRTLLEHANRLLQAAEAIVAR